MIKDPIVEFRNVSKIFELHDNVQSVFWANLPIINKLRGARGGLLRKKVALKDLSFSIQHGEKVGVIGRNGSGKTTLLRLVIGQTQQSRGEIIRNGNCQALMQTGFGFSPELSGIENIRNSLLYNGLDLSEHDFFINDIIDFVELGDFIKYPLKTYSLGMHARLEFATATAIRPDILVVDEVMGAGDGYFARKSAERMRNLVEKSTLILVSHSLQQINEFCDRVLWLNEGELVADGPAVDVIRQYEEFMAEYNSQRQLTVGPRSLAPEEDELFENTGGVVIKFMEMIDSEGRREDISIQVQQPTTAKYLVCPVGDPVRFDLDVTLPSKETLYAELHMWGFSPSGGFMFRATSPVQNYASNGPQHVVLSKAQFPAGIGEYLVFFGLVQPEFGDIIAVSHDHIKVRVPPTNYSDPPLVHLEGTWHCDGDTSQAARIDARV